MSRAADGALEARKRAVGQLAASGVRLPTFAELAEPTTIDPARVAGLAQVDPDAPDPRNLFRVHWHNAADRRGRTEVPVHLVLPEALTGVRAPILVALADRFPLIGAHKVLAAYACLAPRLVTGGFDPTSQRAIWPSTGNYCRGGVAISRILGCRGVAVLPEGMSAERFRWLARWVDDPADVIRTPGSESNVREIYEACDELARDPRNVVLNQFSEFANRLAHWSCTGPALERVFLAARAERPGLRLFALASASGSGGALAAGDWLKARHGSRTAAVEALECPTMLYNGFGEHNIQGIGDKHVPLIQNVMAQDYVVAISDRATDRLNVVFNTEVGRAWLARERGVEPELAAGLAHLGLSSLCNVLACIELAKREQLGPDDALVTIATDGAALYASEIEKAVAKHFAGRFDGRGAAATFARFVDGPPTEHLLALGVHERERIFNLGYFTWVEQRGVSLSDFVARRDPEFWAALPARLPEWDAAIEAFNAETGAR